MRSRQFRRRDHLLHRQRVVCQRDIIAHRLVEKNIVLQDDADLPPQPGRIGERQIRPVDENAPFVGDVKPLDELRQGRFARSRWSDDAKHLPRRNVEVDAAKDIGRVGAIAEADALKADRAFDRRQRGARRIMRRLAGHVQYVAEAVDRNPDLLEILPQLRQPQDRLRHAPREHVEGNEAADTHIARDDRLGTDIEDRDGREFRHQLDRMIAPDRQHRDAETGRDVARELPLPPVAHPRLDRHRLQRADARYRLDQKGLVFGAAVEFLVQPGADRRGHEY